MFSHSKLLLPLGPIVNSELFSNYWLNNRLPLEPDWQELIPEAEAVLKKLRRIWDEQRPRVEKYGKEAPLEQGFHTTSLGGPRLEALLSGARPRKETRLRALRGE